MRLLKAVHRRTQTLERMFQRLGILRRTRGLVRGGLREVGDAAGLLVVRFGKRADFRLQRAEHLEQFAFAPVADGIRAVNFCFNFANRVFDHVVKVFAVENSASAFTIFQRVAEAAGRVPRWRRKRFRRAARR